MDSFAETNPVDIDVALFQEHERTAPSTDRPRMFELGPISCEAGGSLPSVTVAYETWGTLSPAKDNAILVCHALSGDSHAIGWWSRLVGPGKAIDTNKYFVVGSNALGGCQGTTGPASRAPDGQRYRLRFPIITIGDMVELQARLLDVLGIDTLLAVAGGSMGGMQALEWSVRFPNRVRKVFATATCAAHSAMQIGFNECARQAIMRDPEWSEGNYEPDAQPNGLAVARMIGHLSFLSDQAFTSKFGRRLRNKEAFDYAMETEFEVESYLNYQGTKFTSRFDANSMLYLTRAIDYYDLKSFGAASADFLFVSFTSDWIYPTYQSVRLQKMADSAGLRSTHEIIDLPYGHDAFLLDGDLQGQALADFLTR